MIALNRLFTPLCLCPPEVERLTEEFVATGAPVWNFDELKQALLTTSSGKCAYCECKLAVESKYVEVEHFFCKEHHPGRVLDWMNLLPACKRCNGSKGHHNVAIDPILDPYDSRPPEHLSLRLYRIVGITGIGQLTVEVLRLNDSDRLVAVRFEVGEWIIEAVAESNDRLAAYLARADTRSRNRLVARVHSLLTECQPQAQYSATSATVLHSDPGYLSLIRQMKNHDVWTEDLERMHALSATLVLPTS